MRETSAIAEARAALDPARRPVSAIRPGWVEAVAHLHPKYGGLSAAVPALSSAVAEAGRYRIALGGFCLPEEEFRPAVAGHVAVEHFPLGRLSWLGSPAVRRRFRELVAHSAGVHIHGLWQASSAAAAYLARAENKPYLVSAHGMLEPWALAHKGWKKRWYARLLEGRVLGSAACLHALTEAEAEDYRGFGLRAPIAVIPNGVTLPAEHSPEPFLRAFPELAGRRLVLFLGRLHPKKGLDILCEAWARVSAAHPDAHLVLAGPDFAGTRAGIERSLEHLGISERVTLTGMLEGKQKWSALKAAECFVLPSYSEGLSVSTLEAMGMGLPVLISRACHLPEVREERCGLTIEARAEEVEAGLDDLLRARAGERAAMGENGRRLVRARYSWPAIGRRMSALYDWLAGEGAAPAEVQFSRGGTR